MGRPVHAQLFLLNCLPGHVCRDPDPRGALQAGPDDVAGVAVEGELVEVVDCELRHSDDPRRTEVAIYFMFG